MKPKTINENSNKKQITITTFFSRSSSEDLKAKISDSRSMLEKKPKLFYSLEELVKEKLSSNIPNADDIVNNEVNDVSDISATQIDTHHLPVFIKNQDLQKEEEETRVVEAFRNWNIKLFEKKKERGNYIKHISEIISPKKYNEKYIQRILNTIIYNKKLSGLAANLILELLDKQEVIINIEQIKVLLNIIGYIKEEQTLQIEKGNINTLGDFPWFCIDLILRLFLEIVRSYKKNSQRYSYRNDECIEYIAQVTTNMMMDPMFFEYYNSLIRIICQIDNKSLQHVDYKALNNHIAPMSLSCFVDYIHTRIHINNYLENTRKLVIDYLINESRVDSETRRLTKSKIPTILLRVVEKLQNDISNKNYAKVTYLVSLIDLMLAGDVVQKDNVDIKKIKELIHKTYASINDSKNIDISKSLAKDCLHNTYLRLMYSMD